MSDELRTLDQNIISKLVIDGDLKGLSPAQRVDYYQFRCQQAGLDPSAKPFDLLTLNGKMILYANATATQQLTNNRNLSHQITGRELTDGIYCVFCRVTGQDGRSTENMGAVPVDKLQGEAKANAYLKATTKAIRRAVLAHCGLGLMDETEVETIPGAQRLDLPELGTKTETVKSETSGWSLEDDGAFSSLIGTDLYSIFKAGGHPELFQKESDIWRERKKTGTAADVLGGLRERIKSLKEAAEKALKAKATPAAATAPATAPLPMDEPPPSDDPGPEFVEAEIVSNVPKVGTPEYAEAAKAALNAAGKRFVDAYTKAGIVPSPMDEFKAVRNEITKGLKFKGGETHDEKIFILADALQSEANRLLIP